METKKSEKLFELLGELVPELKEKFESAKKEQAEYYASAETKIRAVRNEIDTLINSTIGIIPCREASLCKTELQRSKHFLGLVLGVLGSANPYPASTDHTSAVIEKQAEHSEDKLTFPEGDNVSSIKFMRAEIQKTIDNLDKITEETNAIPNKAKFWIANSYVSITEAKCWLGWNLNEIKKADDLKANTNFTVEG